MKIKTDLNSIQITSEKIIEVKKEASEKIRKSKEIGERLELSEKGRLMSEIKEAIDKLPEVRREKVERIKKELEAGTYKVSDEELAMKLAEKFIEEMLF